MTEPLDPPAEEPPPKQRKGFALLTPERQRQVSAMGGKAAHQLGKAHEWTPEQAREACLKSVQKRIERDKHKFYEPPPENES